MAEASARQARYPNLKRNVKGQGPPTAGKPGGNGAWSKKRRAKKVEVVEETENEGAITSHVTTKTRLVLHDMTPAGKLKRQEQFLEGLIEFGTIRAGCRAAEVDRPTYYRWIEQDPDFKAAVEYTFEDHADDLEQEAYRRAKEKSDLLLMFAIKRFRPAFRDNYKGAEGGKAGDEAMKQKTAAAQVQSRLAALRKRQEAQTKKLPAKVGNPPGTFDNKFDEED